MLGIIGKKIGMTRIFDESGNSIPVTAIEAGPCYITQVKTTETDGYESVQMGFGDKKEKLATKAQIGHAAKAGLKPFRVLKEFKSFESNQEIKIGSEIKADIFKIGDVVSVSGITKGKGFAGVVKRYNFGGGPKTHGQSDRLRAPGSIGQSSWPSKVFKGLKMAGRMGGKKNTTRGLKIVSVDAENNILLIKGAVPGAKNGTIIIRK